MRCGRCVNKTKRRNDETTKKTRRLRCGLNDCAEGGVVARGNIRKDLAIQRDAGGLERIYQLAVCRAVHARGSVDALNPERMQLTAMIAAIFGRISQRMQTRFVRLANVLVASAELTLRHRKDTVVAPARLDSTFDSCHD